MESHCLPAGLTMDAPTLLHTIQLAITPVILISGLGSLLLTMTNRLGRIVDRTRILAVQTQAASGIEKECQHLQSQLRIMYRRARLVQRAVTYTTLSMVASALLVLAIFVNTVLEQKLTYVIVGLFGVSVLSLLCGLSYFLRDIHLALAAIRIEVNRALRLD
jgi:Protein of unknown function (DUF2721)